MKQLTVPQATDGRLDLLALGEVMLRLDPGEGRVRTARSFRVWEGGGEYNVARGLRRCFGLRTGVVTAIADNEIGRLIEDLILQGGVDTDFIRWVPATSNTTRNGLNFTERGFGIRGALGVSDRGHTAACQMKASDVDWDEVFERARPRVFHTGGVYAGLSAEAVDVVSGAMIAARRHGVLVSYDLNYRASIWSLVGGAARAQEVHQQLMKYVDIVFGNEEDYALCLGHGSRSLDPAEGVLSPQNFMQSLTATAEAYPDLAVAAMTLRGVHSATSNDWTAFALAHSGFVEAAARPRLEILDRVGGGDAFASGLLYALLAGRTLEEAVDYGAAHGALVMTTPGDTSMASLREVEALVAGAPPRVQR